ncbi:DUF1223 domain-containing protein [Shewanella sp. GXUN23E]|uniref:DUF1223 domain-containing protein n=1 Tax=Shewanella sp. GXUN23E TaxID=3422498 RepID=UPI003D7EE6BF
MAHGAGQRYVSSQFAPLMIELFTSQGCSSCPPADEWLAKLQQHPQLWQRVFPLAFHVTYWNDLGWPDTWSKASFSNRQYAHFRQGLGSQVYTPQLFANGEELRRWSLLGWSLMSLPALPGESVGKLEVMLNGTDLTAVFHGHLPAKARLNFAWVVPVSEVQIRRGENQGRTLTNPFVVLSVTEIGRSDSGFAGVIPDKPDPGQARYWVAWLELQGRPLQAEGALVN